MFEASGVAESQQHNVKQHAKAIKLKEAPPRLPMEKKSTEDALF